MVRLTIIFFLSVLFFESSAQHKIGVRAGSNLSTFSGELEQGESYGLSLGFHFGVNYTYQFSPVLGLRGELLYTQRGSKNSLIDTVDGAYLLINPIGDIEPYYELGKMDFDMDISTGYLSLPLTLHVSVTDKWELFGGISVDMLFSPVGRGKVDFTSGDGSYFFIQSFEYNYRRDDAGQLHELSTFSPPLIIDLNGEKANLYSIETAYQNLTEEDLEGGKKFNRFDSHVIFGVNYFINQGFYIGARAELGLMDMTNENTDFSRKDLTPEGTFLLRDDKDRSRSLNLSVGFRF